MADELNRWLDRETAERLLRGEPLEAVDPADRDQAERLAKTLEALTAEPAPTCGELPGEAAALAAYRAARAGRAITAATPGAPGGQAADEVGLVRLGGPGARPRRPRWGRPVRLALAAALAVGMVGGVAVAAGTGVLPTPFDDDEPARPAATVPAPPPTERPLVSPSPERNAPEGSGPGGSVAPADPGATEGTDPGGPADDEATGDGRRGSGGWWRGVVSSCRDLRDGKALSGERRRALTGAAGGRDRVRTYCEKVLGHVDARTGGDADDRGRDKGKGHGGDDGRHDDGDWSDRGDSRHDGEDDAPNGLTRGDDGSGDDRHTEGDASPGRGAPRAASTPTPTPTPTASAASR
ncbi:hypothetical protein [Streptomyces sp. NPDC056628]|uniref:hypothetical protein n=1 Tax=Streptomyces sp. NPDC056628 TaxID=3345882 RepID=UPI00367E5698